MNGVGSVSVFGKENPTTSISGNVGFSFPVTASTTIDDPPIVTGKQIGRAHV